MQLSGLAELYERPGPFLTAYLSPGAPDADAAKQLELRWRALADEARAQGADEATVEAVGGLLAARTSGAQAVGGAVVVATGGDVVYDAPLHGPVGRDAVRWSRLPDLAPAVRANAVSRHSLVAVIDRAGADLRIQDVSGAYQQEREVVGQDGGPLHKVPGGGWSHKRWQNAVDEAVGHNATQIAEEIQRLAARTRPAAIVLAGGVEARETVRRKLGPALEPLVSVTDHGGRDSEDDDHLRQAVVDIAAKTEHEVRSRLLDRFGEGRPAGLAVQGLELVVEAGRQGAIDVLLLAVDNVDAGLPPEAARAEATVTPDGMAPGAPPSEQLVDLADAIAVRAGALNSATAEVVYTDEAELTDGLGALLRFPLPSA